MSPPTGLGLITRDVTNASSNQKSATLSLTREHGGFLVSCVIINACRTLGGAGTDNSESLVLDEVFACHLSRLLKAHNVQDAWSNIGKDTIFYVGVLVFGYIDEWHRIE